jgi:hypothetical protein
MLVKVWHCLNGPDRRSFRILAARFHRHLRREGEPGHDFGQLRFDRSSMVGHGG